MDWMKYPLDKLLYFIAAIIPGFTALSLFVLHRPAAFDWFFTLQSLGYNTKLAIVLLVAFVVGYTITTVLNIFFGGLGGAIGGALGSLLPVKLAHEYSTAPWRDRTWRSLVKKHLGAHAPTDSQLVMEPLYDLQLKMIEHLPLTEKLTKSQELVSAKLSAQRDDQDWNGWYDQYHRTVLEPREFTHQVRNSLNANLEATAYYLLVSTIWVPAIRHWWFVLPACVWTLISALEIYWIVHQARDKWATLSAQIKYLSEKPTA